MPIRPMDEIPESSASLIVSCLIFGKFGLYCIVISIISFCEDTAMNNKVYITSVALLQIYHTSCLAFNFGGLWQKTEVESASLSVTVSELDKIFSSADLRSTNL